MKILHVLAQLPSKTGSGVYFTNVIKGLADQQNACIYGCYPGFDQGSVPVAKQYPVVFPNDQCGFPLPGMSDVMPYESTVYGEMTPEMIADWQAAFTKQVRAALASFQPDLIFCHHLWFLTALVCREARVPVYAFCHGTDIRQARQHPDLKERYLDGLEKVHHVFALSRPEEEQISATYGLPTSKISVIGGGYDPAIFYPGKPEDRSTVKIIYAGKIAAAKGVFALAKVFGQLSRDYPAVQLQLVGNASEAAQQKLRPALANPQLTISPAVDQQTLAAMYRHSDIFVLPSYYEGLGLAAIEALACNLRVVSTTIPALQAQLGPEVNDSGVISYVDLPRIVNQDVPVEADLPAFYDRLRTALEGQIAAVQKRVSFPSAVQAAVQKSSWPGLIKRIRQLAAI